MRFIGFDVKRPSVRDVVIGVVIGVSIGFLFGYLDRLSGAFDDGVTFHVPTAIGAFVGSLLSSMGIHPENRPLRFLLVVTAVTVAFFLTSLVL